MINGKTDALFFSSIGNDERRIEKVELVHSGEDYFSRLLAIISLAQIEIHLQTYIFENDSTGIKIANALKEAASRQVKIYVLLDAYGSFLLPESFVNELRQTGIHIRFFSPFLAVNSFYIGRRLHHKVVVVDGYLALIGGINIADKYHGNVQETAWLDYAVQIESNKIGTYLQTLCRDIFFKQKNKEVISLPLFSSRKDAFINITRNDWLHFTHDIYDSYIEYIRSAEKEIIIVGSYFLPSRKMKKVLKKAAARGVKVRIILSGISDVPLVRRAASHLYSSLLRHNIELYEWHKSVLHGKVAVVDGKWATIGSFNLNHLSSYGSIEMNVAINSVDFSTFFALHLRSIVLQCEKITTQKLTIRNTLITKFINWLAYRLIRMVLIFSTYLLQKRY